MARLCRTLRVFATAAIVCSVASPTSTQCSVEDDSVVEFRTDFMQQQQLGFLRRFATEEVPAPRALPTPITWIHIPRTGASFEYTLLSSTALCPNLVLPSDGDLRDMHVTDVVHQCPGLNLDEKCNMVQTFDMCAEMSIGDSRRYAEIEGKIVGFFRQPEVRIISDYHNSGLAGDYDVKGFATERQGCVTKMLTYSDDEFGDDHCRGGAPTQEQVALAQHRVKTGYAFIGMTDDWNLSICLFNAMFGNQCHSAQFQSFGGHTTEYDSHDLSMLRGFEDIYDGEVFKTARIMWSENLIRYNITDETCQPCSES